MMGRLTPSARQTLAATMARVNRKRRPPSVMIPAAILSNKDNAAHPSRGEAAAICRQETNFWDGPSRASGRHSGLVVGHALLVEELGQLTLLEHLADDVAATHELALDVELRDRRPLREAFDALADAHVLEHVDVLVVDTHMTQDLSDLCREPALGKILVPLHEKDHVVAGDGLADPVLDGLLAH